MNKVLKKTTNGVFNNSVNISMFSSSALSNSLFSIVTLFGLFGLVSFGMVGCASTNNGNGKLNTNGISPQYVSSTAYQSYDCAGLQQEFKRLNSYITQTQQQQSGITATGVGVGISAGRWGISPNITFGLGKSNSNISKNNRLSKLYGEHDALIQAARLKYCQFSNNLKLYTE